MQNKIGHPIHITVPITKIDEEQRMVWGYATVEEVDKHGEIIGYEASKEAFAAWPGNIREMHDPVAVGVNKEVQYDDDAKGVWIGAYISESADGDNAWTKVKEGVLQGFSIGGNIKDYEVIKIEDEPRIRVTSYDLNEVSLVDNPACPSAIFQMVKSAAGGGLVRTEELRKGPGRPVAWWEEAFHFSMTQKVIKHVGFRYNENSMSKKQTLIKSLWEAESLVWLAESLADYIYWKAWEGVDMAELKTALDQIKQAAIGELSEDENFPEVETAIENACKALNITKKEELVKMTQDRKEVKKSVVGSEDRDANGEVVVTAEENGRPLNDTAERALENNLPVAGTINEDGSVQASVHAEGTVQDHGTTATVEQAATDAAVEPEEVEEDTEEPKDKPKAATAEDLKKSADTELVSQILKGVGQMIDEKVAPIQEELNQLKGKPAVSKAKASFTEVDKVEKMETPQSTAKDEFDSLMKRADVLAADPYAGTPAERIEVAVKLRKNASLMSPERMAQHNAIRSQFDQAV